MFEGPEPVVKLSYTVIFDELVGHCAMTKMEEDEVREGSKGPNCRNDLGFHS